MPELFCLEGFAAVSQRVGGRESKRQGFTAKADS